MKTLWLLRHAKSAWDTDAVTDYARPLARRGRRDAARMGQCLHEQGVAVDRAICSGALRASQTLAGVRERWLVTDQSVQFTDDLYHAGSADLLAVLHATPAGHRGLMLVGHNPGLDGLLRQLCGRDLPLSASGKLMTTAALAQIQLNGWQAKSGHLLNLFRPKEL